MFALTFLINAFDAHLLSLSITASLAPPAASFVASLILPKCSTRNPPDLVSILPSPFLLAPFLRDPHASACQAVSRLAPRPRLPLRTIPESHQRRFLRIPLPLEHPKQSSSTTFPSPDSRLSCATDSRLHQHRSYFP